MVCTGVVLVVFCKFNGRFIIQKKGGRVEVKIEELWKEGAKLKCFLCSMSDSNVLSFRHWQGNDLLLFSAPENSTAMNQKCIPQNSMLILSHASIHICVSHYIHFVNPYESHSSIVLFRYWKILFMAFQCTGLGFVEKHEMVWTANAMSGQVPRAAYISDLTASW